MSIARELEPGAVWGDVVVADDPAFASVRPRHTPRTSAAETMFNKAVYAASMLQRQGMPITVDTLHSENGEITRKQWVDLIVSDKFLEALEDRGIVVAGHGGLSPQQLSALAIYFDMTLKMTHAQRLKAAGITQAKWDGWQRQDAFAREYGALAEERITAAAPLALVRTAEAVDAGERWAIELTLEVTGRHDRRPHPVDLNSLFMGLFTILDDEGIDAAVMARIGGKVKEILGGGAPQPQLVTIPSTSTPSTMSSTTDAPPGGDTAALEQEQTV